MAVNSKQKGARFERLLASRFREYGYEARRTAQYCGNTGDASDVIGLPGIHCEAKHQERMQLYDQPYSLPDSADRGVPDCRVDDALLSARLHAVIGCIKYLDYEILFARLLKVRCPNPRSSSIPPHFWTFLIR